MKLACSTLHVKSNTTQFEKYISSKFCTHILGEECGLHSTHTYGYKTNLFQHNVSNAGPESLRCQCLVPCSKSGTSEIHWPFCQPIPAIMPFRFSPIELYSTRLPEHFNYTLNARWKYKGCGHEFGKTLKHGVPQILQITLVSGPAGLTRPTELQGVCCCQAPG